MEAGKALILVKSVVGKMHYNNIKVSIREEPAKKNGILHAI